jgi:predicted nucleic acid-binding protein
MQVSGKKKPIIPYDKSFASHEKAKFWHSTLNKEVLPRNITKGKSTREFRR